MLFKRISMQEAEALMGEAGSIIVDVRGRDEYAEGHIPGAVSLPLDEIGYDPPEELPELDAPIFVYCAGGVRSVAAAYKLAQMGYENIHDCGGIKDWHGKTVAGTEAGEPLSKPQAEEPPSEAEQGAAPEVGAAHPAQGCFVYTRRANYHETDKMGIIHHSNYIKWMEEARMAYLAHIGIDYAAMERAGAYSPVVSLTVDYKRPVEFGDDMELRVSVAKHSGVATEFAYVVYNASKNEISAEAHSKHCFVINGRPIVLKKVFPDEDAALLKEAEGTESR